MSTNNNSDSIDMEDFQQYKADLRRTDQALISFRTHFKSTIGGQCDDPKDDIGIDKAFPLLESSEMSIEKREDDFQNYLEHNKRCRPLAFEDLNLEELPPGTEDKWHDWHMAHMYHELGLGKMIAYSQEGVLPTYCSTHGDPFTQPLRVSSSNSASPYRSLSRALYQRDALVTLVAQGTALLFDHREQFPSHWKLSQDAFRIKTDLIGPMHQNDQCSSQNGTMLTELSSINKADYDKATNEIADLATEVAAIGLSFGQMGLIHQSRIFESLAGGMKYWQAALEGQIEAVDGFET